MLQLLLVISKLEDIGVSVVQLPDGDNNDIVSTEYYKHNTSILMDMLR